MATQLRFATGCAITRREDGVLGIQWDNENSVAATTGAAVDHIDAHMRMRGRIDGEDFIYLFSHDVAAMIAGNVGARLALIIAFCRKTIMSMDGVVVNESATVRVPEDAQEPPIEQAHFNALVAEESHVVGIIQQSLSVLGMNGLTLLSKGMAYDDSDNMWDRLDNATDIAQHFESLGIADWEHALYHDMAHAFDVPWKVRLVVDIDTPLTGKINGVVMTRLPGTPAGTSVVFAGLETIRQLLVAKPASAEVIYAVKLVLEAIVDRIRADPLEWCSHMQAGNVTRNLQVIEQIKPSLAFVHGMAVHTFGRNSTLTKAVALKTVASANLGMASDGAKYAADIEDEDKDDGVYRRQLGEHLAKAREALGNLGIAVELPEFEDGNAIADDDSSGDESAVTGETGDEEDEPGEGVVEAGNVD